MKLVPISYNLRSLLVRRGATMLTVLGIGATVSVLAGVLSLKHGFERLFGESGREEIVILMRPGAGSEGESMISRERMNVLVKSSPEIATDADGRALAAAETYLAVRRFKLDGGETNVPVRGVQPMSFVLAGDLFRMVEGRRFTPGSDEVIVGAKLRSRIRSSNVGDVIVLNTKPFRVVGTFEYDGPFASEIWGDVDRLGEALERPGFNRVVARLRSDTSFARFAERLKDDQQAPAKAMTERDYLTAQTQAFSLVLGSLGVFLAAVMGVAAVFTATNTMLAAISSRSYEIGILKSLGFRPLSIFLSFLLEAVLLGFVGGAVGCLFTLPLHGIETGTTNFNTFTEVAFAFRVTGRVLVTAVLFAVVLGVLGGAWPAWRAARMMPTQALRRQ